MSKSIGEVKEKIIEATELDGAFGQNMHESKEVVIRTPEGIYSIDEVLVTAIAGKFVMMLDTSPFKEPQ